MTERDALQTASGAAISPRRQFIVQTFTTLYDPVEDRIRLNAVDRTGGKQSVLLTRRLMDQVIPVITRNLEAKSPPGGPTKIIQSMNQELIRQVRREGSASGSMTLPVKCEPETREWLCKVIHFKCFPNGLLVILTDDRTIDVVLPLAETVQRALLDIFRATYTRANWSPQAFPAWLEEFPMDATGQGAQLRLN